MGRACRASTSRSADHQQVWQGRSTWPGTATGHCRGSDCRNPLVIGVSTRNLCDFLTFIGDSATRLRPDIEAITAGAGTQLSVGLTSDSSRGSVITSRCSSMCCRSARRDGVAAPDEPHPCILSYAIFTSLTIKETKPTIDQGI